jgi:hypothetical protein
LFQQKVLKPPGNVALLRVYSEHLSYVECRTRDASLRR